MGRRKDTMGRLVDQATMGSTMGRRKDGKKGGHKLGNICPWISLFNHPNKPMGDQSHAYSLVVCLHNILLFFFEHCIFNLNLFNDLCWWVFNPVGRPPKSLIIRDWPLPRSKSHFSRIYLFFIILDFCLWFKFGFVCRIF